MFGRRESWVAEEQHQGNSIARFLQVLDQLSAMDSAIFSGKVNIFATFQGGPSFASEAQEAIKSRIEGAVIHRGTKATTFDDLRQMASADVLVASASHFSAFAAYMAKPTSLVVLHTANGYFDVHKEINGNVYVVDDPALPHQISSLVQKNVR